jgi:hypothetical protein
MARSKKSERGTRLDARPWLMKTLGVEPRFMRSRLMISTSRSVKRAASFSCCDSKLHDCPAHRRLYSRTVVIDRNHDLFALFRAGEPDLGASPLAGVVEQVAEHLVEIFSLSPKGGRLGR